MPITSCWGPGYFDPNTLGKTKDVVLEDTVWQRFRANSSGLEAFTATYRGPAANYRSAKDYSYQMAVTLLTQGYDVLVCRLCPGTFAQSRQLVDSVNGGKLTLKAKYPGTFGNNLLCSLTKVPNKNRWKFIIYVVDASGTRSAVENLSFVFDLDNSSDNIPHINEVTSAFVDFEIDGVLKEDSNFGDLSAGIKLGDASGVAGTDRTAEDTATPTDIITDAYNLATARYLAVTPTPDDVDYVAAIKALISYPSLEKSVASRIRYNEWLYTNLVDVMELLKDKLAYNHNRVITSGWDDQNISEINGETLATMAYVSPLHIELMSVAYYSRCATAFIDVPKSLQRSGVYNESTDTTLEGYAQKLARYIPHEDTDGLFSTHSALFGPWGTFRFVGTTKQCIACPSFLKLAIDRSMILNQSIQYEWVLPSSRSNSVQIGSLDYTVPKKVLDLWQPDPDQDGGVGVNAIADIPGLGISVWGNSTLFENEPASYQALRSLSTRLLVNAIKDVAYKTGVGITFNYNNQSAYSKFYMGVTPLLDQMKNVGAIEDYLVRMGSEIDAEGMVMANSCVGKIWIVPVGSIERITIDLIAMPVGTDLTSVE